MKTKQCSMLHRIGRWLLMRALPGDYRDVIAGDLEVHMARGKNSAWYVRQVLASLHPLRLWQLHRDVRKTNPPIPGKGVAAVHYLIEDLKQGVRVMLRAPTLAAAAVVALALGIGLTTTMFSITYGVLYRGLPFENSEQLVQLQRRNVATGQDQLSVSIHDFEDWRARQHSFVDLAAFSNTMVTVSGRGGDREKPDLLQATYLTTNAFAMLPVKAALGRLFANGEDNPGAEKVAVLSHRTWTARYSSDSAIVGRTIWVDGAPTTVVGVMPPGFQFPSRQQIWMPLNTHASGLERGQLVEGQWLEGFGRLRNGVSLAHAQAEFDGIAAQLSREFPKSNENIRASLGTFSRRYIGEQAASLLLTMLGAVFLVLLVACTNVASLLISRAIKRSREVSVRTALGASRARIVTQFLGESLALALAGAALGVIVAIFGVRAFNAGVNVDRLPYWVSISVDGVALAFVLSISVLSALLAGTLPALQASRAKASDVLKDGSRGASSFRLGRVSRSLVVFEVALSCGLLVAAGLTITSVVKLRNIDLGFDAASLFTARIELPAGRYSAPEQQTAFHDDLERRIRSIAGVESATLTSRLPGLGGMGMRFALEGATYVREQDYPYAEQVGVTPEFFKTLGVRLLGGRDINRGDVAGTLPVAILNEPFVAKHFPKLARPELAVGQRIRINNNDSTARWLTVVGVVPDASAGELSESRLRAPAFYTPLAQSPETFVYVLARTRGDPTVLTARVRDVIAAIDRDLALADPASLLDAVARDTWFIPLFGGMFLIFGAAALVMAVVGLYAVTAFAVTQRTRELGIRMALGARTANLMGMVLRQSLMQVGIGTVIGLGMAFGLAQLLAVIMFDVNPRDPTVYGGVVAILSMTALVACVVPAWRATRVHPTEALRSE